MLFKVILAVLFVLQVMAVKVPSHVATSSTTGFFPCVKVTSCPPNVNYPACGRKNDGTTLDFNSPCEACLNTSFTRVKPGKCT